MRFDTPEAMLEFIQDGNDLYSPSMELYVFAYNEEGSICSYDISVNEAKELAAKSDESGDYWAAFLGVGGNIYDDPSHELYRGYEDSNLDYCYQLIEARDWIKV